MSIKGPEEKAIHWAEALGLSAVVHVAAVYLLFNLTVDLDDLMPEDEPDRAELLITSVTLDTEALVSATSQTSGDEDLEAIDPANELNDLAGIEPDTLDPVTPTDNIPDEVEPVEDPDALPEIETPEAVAELETLAPVEDNEGPEDVAALEPEVLEGTEVLEASAPELVPEEIAPVAQASALAPEAISPLRPESPTLDAASPTSTLSASPERLAAIAPTTVAPERIAPRDTDIGTISTAAAAAAASAPVRSLPTVAPPAPGTPEAVVSELVSNIRANVSDTCLIAIPQQAANGAPELVIVTASEADVAPYADAVLDGVEPRPGQRSVLVDARQCAVLDYVRQNRSYPAFRMSFGLSADQIDSGDQLVGAIGRTAGRYVSLVMVDDNGVVQDLGQYLSFTGGGARFDVPLRRAGAARDTKQLLVAIGTNSRPTSVDTQNGQLATDYFDALTSEVGTNVPIVMLPFDVR